MTKLSKWEKNAVKAAMRRVFAAGELWGITHSTWFDPCLEETNKKANEAINKAMRTFAALSRDYRTKRKAWS